MVSTEAVEMIVAAREQMTNGHLYIYIIPWLVASVSKTDTISLTASV